MRGNEGLDRAYVHGKHRRSGRTAARLREQMRKGDALPVDMGKAMDKCGESKPEAAPSLGDAERNHDGARTWHQLFSSLGFMGDASTSSLRAG
jgi:hypothetical protein